MTNDDALPSKEEPEALRPQSILLLATANDRSAGGRPLRNLPDERRRISKALEDRVEIALLPDAMIEEVFLAFAHPKKRDRIRIFHFAGHASASWLAFQTEDGDVAHAGATGLTSFLRRQEGLVLVFLNGCWTRHQVTLLREGVRAVIGTTEAVQDHVAARFAAKLYECLAADRTLAESFEDAKSFIMAELEDEVRGATRDLDFAPSSSPPRQQWPWFLDCDEASESWRIDQPPPRRDLDVYRERVRSLLQEVSFPHQGTGPRAIARLDELYIPIPAVVHHGAPKHRPSGDGDDLFGADRDVPIERLFPTAEERGTRGVLVLGGPGTGKTWYLRRLLVRLLDEGPAALGMCGDTVPIFLSLRRVDYHETLLDFMVSELTRSPLRMSPRLADWLWRRGKLLLVLDGLDEVTRAHDRARIVRWIADLRQTRKDVFVVVSSRLSSCHLDDELDEWFLALRMRPMGDDLVRGFVRNWYQAEDRAASDDGNSALSRTDPLVTTLLGLLDQPEGSSWLHAMTNNPLLLRTICAHGIDHDFGPQSRNRLQQEAMSMLLQARREEKHLPVTMLAEHAQRLLQAIAWWMHRQGRTRARFSELEEPVAEVQRELGLRDVEPRSLLESIRTETDLLVARSMDELELSSSELQEYLAAREFLARMTTHEPGEMATRLAWLAEGFGDDRQRELVLHVATLAEPPTFRHFMAEVTRQPDFPVWAESSLMDACWAASPSMCELAFVEGLESDEPRRLPTEHLLAIALSLAHRSPRCLLDRDQLLRAHPIPDLRAWWQQHANEVERSQPFLSRGGLEMVPIPGGRFVMGSEDGADMPGGRARHEVELSSFFLARTPVTNAQYTRYLAENPDGGTLPYEGHEDLTRPDLPVVGVSWDDACAFCEWAGLSLPTEAQWEYACRGGGDSRSSEHDMMNAGWYRENSALLLRAVAQKDPNGFGLHDMHGNVQEWCRDGWGEYSAKEPRHGDGLRYEPKGSYRVIRGGSSFHGMEDARATARRPMDRARHQQWLGFRPAFNPSELSPADVPFPTE